MVKDTEIRAWLLMPLTKARSYAGNLVSNVNYVGGAAKIILLDESQKKSSELRRFSGENFERSRSRSASGLNLDNRRVVN